MSFVGQQRLVERTFVSFRTSALFRDEVEVALRGSDALGRRREGVRRLSFDRILCGGPA
jgi:hypothetical protein